MKDDNIINFPEQFISLSQLVAEQYPEEVVDEGYEQINSLFSGKSAPFAMLIMLCYIDFIMEFLESKASKEHRAAFITEIQEATKRWSEQ